MCECVCMHAYVCVFVRVCVYMHAYARMCACMRVCMCMCVRWGVRWGDICVITSSDRKEHK